MKKCVQIFVILLFINIWMISCSTDIKHNNNESVDDDSFFTTTSTTTTTNTFANSTTTTTVSSIDDDSGVFDDDTTDVEIYYQPGDVVIAANYADTYIYVITDPLNHQNYNIIKLFNNLYIEGKPIARSRASTSITVIPTLSKGIKKYLLGFDAGAKIDTDSQGNLHIVYYKSLSTSLVHITDASGHWKETEIAQLDGSIDDIKFFIDKYDYCHVLCYFNTSSKYYTNKSGKWVRETVLGSIYDDMTIDSEGFAHLSSTNGVTVNYTTNVSGKWEVYIAQTFPDLPNWPDFEEAFYYSTIKVDSQNRPHICSAYSAGFSSNPLMFVDVLICSTNNDGVWNSFVAALLPITFIQNLNMQIDQNNDIHLLFTILRYQTLPDPGYHFLHSSNASGIFKTETIKDIGADSISTTLDQDDHIHLSYMELNSYDLYYSTNASGEWVTIPVNSSLGN